MTNGVGGMTYEEAKKILNSLIPKPIRGDGKSGTHFSILWALLMGMDAIDYKEKYRWTPISEGPPKKDGRYLAYIVNKDDPRIKYSMTCQFIQNSIGDNPWFPDDECASNNVVAWMPLPEDYKERKCSTCEHAFTTGKGRWYCEKSLADKDDCGEYKMLEQRQYIEKVSNEDKEE